MNIPGQCYLVGGWVRDQLLGQQPTERDWVVVGATEDQMLAEGFKRIGSHFPVFLHPDTHEEYALARTESKHGRGHQGFKVNVNTDITLEQDLERRDITINSMAMDPAGSVIDPFGGQHDLDSRVIRHVGEAFREDPLRCFRVARFASKLPDFDVAPATTELMRSMSDELNDLPAERVWVEYEKSMKYEQPGRFYRVLIDAGLQDPWFSNLKLDTLAAFHDRVRAHGFAGFAAVAWTQESASASALFSRLKAPKRVQKLVHNVANHGALLANWRAVESSELLDRLTKIKAFLSGKECNDTIAAIEACALVDLTELQQLIRNMREIPPSPNLKGKEIGLRINAKRIELIDQAQS